MDQLPRTPLIGDLKQSQDDHPSVLLTSDGQQLAVFRQEWRQWVPLADISPHVIHALLATEDQRFYAHRGLDWRRTLAAALSTVRGRLQGGSTLTQQLARNLYPDAIGRAPTLERKVREALTALKIERAYGKDDILEIYLNTVPFLYNTYGIEMAARTYFDKPARELDVRESATLVGMLKGTTYYNPVLNPERARERRNIVMAQMVRTGELEAQRFEQLKDTPLQVKFERRDEQLGPAPHFTVLLRRWLIDWADRNGYNIYADGLVVRTTLDSRAQAMAAAALARQADTLQQRVDKAWDGRKGWAAQRALVDTFIRETPQFQAARAGGQDEAQAIARLRTDARFMQALRAGKTRLEAGLVAVEPGTGYVRAWVGSRDFAIDQYDHVNQARRQPGSTFKPFVYGAAFELGALPTDMLIDEPMEYVTPDGKIWRPTDIGEPSYEPVSLHDALARSKNTITAQLIHHVGADAVARLAQAMGVRDSRLDPVPSLGLGTSGVTLREMAAAYATIANGGDYVAPLLVLSVEDRRGRVLESFAPAAPEPALSPAADAELLDAMRAAIDRGTGAAIRSRYKLRGELAGKTGTTQYNTDGWFILMHPRLVAGAWVGFNDSRITMPDAWGQGARSALPMVGEFMGLLAEARLVDAKARFPAAPEPFSWEPQAPQWGALFPRPPQLQPELVPLTPVNPYPAEYGVNTGPALGFPPVQSVVVAPSPVESAGGRGVERAIVVAPPRDPAAGGGAGPPHRLWTPPGEASGAGPAPLPAIPGLPGGGYQGP
ncbi:transglycosylase domain-containing protein [Ramlibacter tataouinensis]|nr:transglycosylase domain-containing protein [Ramlibacter tataouinensis]WBY04009.1 transglycosylase domain-containing protein [Ramlibacter tataouinensis]